jgi:hypothetical protein
MNRINEFNLEPGTYIDQAQNVVVMVDVITELYKEDADLLDRLSDPLVVTRPLDGLSKIEHHRMAYPISVFTQRFTKTTI